LESLIRARQGRRRRSNFLALAQGLQLVGLLGIRLKGKYLVVVDCSRPDLMSSVKLAHLTLNRRRRSHLLFRGYFLFARLIVNRYPRRSHFPSLMQECMST
jgi:hypothetical protein